MKSKTLWKPEGVQSIPAGGSRCCITHAGLAAAEIGAAESRALKCGQRPSASAGCWATAYGLTECFQQPLNENRVEVRSMTVQLQW